MTKNQLCFSSDLSFSGNINRAWGGLSHELDLKNAEAILVGVPYEGGASEGKGTSFAPHYLRTHSHDMPLISRRGIDLTDINFQDIGDIPIDPMNINETVHRVHDAVIYLASQSSAPIISIGGDHSISYPLIYGIAEGKSTAVIWFDAHPDLLDFYYGSKLSHGSPLLRAIEKGNIDPKNVLIVGFRFWEAEEQQTFEKLGINIMPMYQIEEMPNAVEQFSLKVKEISSRVEQLYVSVDIDVLDPAFAPGTGTPVAGGMSTTQLLAFLWSITPKVRAYDIVEISPALDVSGITSKAGLTVFNEILAKIKMNR